MGHHGQMEFRILRRRHWRSSQDPLMERIHSLVISQSQEECFLNGFDYFIFNDEVRMLLTRDKKSSRLPFDFCSEFCCLHSSSSIAKYSHLIVFSRIWKYPFLLSRDKCESHRTGYKWILRRTTRWCRRPLPVPTCFVQSNVLLWSHLRNYIPRIHLPDHISGLIHPPKALWYTWTKSEKESMVWAWMNV